MRFAILILPIMLMSAAATFAQVRFGVDILIESDYALIRGKRVALVSHAAAQTYRGRSTAEEFAKTNKINLVRLLTPEHGFFGVIEAGKSVEDESLFGVPARSLYGSARRPDSTMLADADVVVVDLQDIGVRSYTFMSTMIEVIDACAQYGKECIVLDRPNPLGGLIVSGGTVDDTLRSFIGRLPIPYVHGCTLGELATMANEEHWLTPVPTRRKQRCSLTVVRCKQWLRSDAWERIDRPWYPTSPNIPSVDAIRGYAIAGVVGELGLWSIGMGTNTPFQIIGAPGLTIDTAIIAALYERGLNCVRARFKPRGGKFSAEVCDGYYLFARPNWRPMEALSLLLWEARRQYPESFPDTLIKTNNGKTLAKALGRSDIITALCQGAPLAKVDALFRRGHDEFLAVRKKYLLYDK
ncbi:MAG: DUF1343 domain-containing protein [Candidatus Kapabacteria bacterium]|nr:DUF1343 domain-containing protein [Candidatus Kapabacteria bacterium]